MSQNDSHSKTIDGHTYTVYMLAPSVSLSLLTDLTKVIGPSLGPVIDVLFGQGGVEGVLKAEIDGKFFAKAATSLFSHIDKDLVKRVVDTLLEVSEVDGKKLKPIWEIQFRGKIGVLLKWLAFALKSQYSDFSSAWEGIVQAGQIIEMPPQSQSQNISTG